MALSTRVPTSPIAGTRQLLALLSGLLLAGYGALAAGRIAGDPPAMLGQAAHELLTLPSALGWVACPLRALSSIACPACGATRAGLALLSFDLPAALRWNPFLVLALAVLLAAGSGALVAPRATERWLAPAGAFMRSQRGRWLLAGALLLASAWQTAHLPSG